LAINIKILWRSFDKQFGDVVECFQRHKKNVEDQALVAHMIEADNAKQERQLEKAQQLVLQKGMAQHIHGAHHFF
jgi:hypothetical protein